MYIVEEVLTNKRVRDIDPSIFQSFVKLELTEDKLLLTLRRCSNFLYDRIDQYLRESNDEEVLDILKGKHYMILPQTAHRMILSRYSDIIHRMTNDTMRCVRIKRSFIKQSLDDLYNISEGMIRAYDTGHKDLGYGEFASAQKWLKILPTIRSMNIVTFSEKFIARDYILGKSGDIYDSAYPIASTIRKEGLFPTNVWFSLMHYKSS